MKNILIIGSGGREHAIGWKLKQSKHINKIYFAPGNGGTNNNVDISLLHINKLVKFAKSHDCFTIVGPETPLASGIVDIFNKNKLRIFGPTKNAAKLEYSKIWAKNFMQTNNIPTAKFAIFNEYKLAINHVKIMDHPIVIKTDVLAAGKGVFVCNNVDESVHVINDIMINNIFGESGKKIIIEEYIKGYELSYIVLSDGNNILPLTTSKDYKRALDHDLGYNTGGMGSYSPIFINNELEKKIKNIMNDTITSMRSIGYPFMGFLYAGIMIKNNTPYVLEFNVRMGDPECQSILMRLRSDLYEYLIACTNGDLYTLPTLKWSKKSAVCIVLASQGYPHKYIKNEIITGLDLIQDNNIAIFHAGTKKIKNKIFTNGGRVLGITALGNTLKSAIHKAYSITNKIYWPNKYYRKDIGEN